MAGEIKVERWLVSRIGKTSWGKPVTHDAAEAKALELSQDTGGPFRLKFRKDEQWGPERTFQELKQTYLPARMKKADLNEVLWIDNRGPWQSTVRMTTCLISTDPLDLSNCTETCEVIIAFLRQKFPQHLNLGWFNCRDIAGTDDWSQHAYGNAYDAGGPFSLLQQIAAALIAGAKAKQLPISQVIFNRQSWEPSSGFSFYGGIDPHTGHVHTSAAPEMHGTPPCAQ